MVGPSPSSLKFVCSYGGKILPRHTDGKLRYYGGETRVLSVDRFIPFSELLVKLGEMYGSPVSLRCQLPTEDLDALVSITSDEDLANLIEEHDRCSSLSLKIRAFLSPPKSTKKYPRPISTASSSTTDDSSSPKVSYTSPRHLSPRSGGLKYANQISTSPCYGVRPPQCGHHFAAGNNGHVHLIHHGNHWQ
ncbi:unnamed protein product [Cuscuta campestris]|uniref:PB1 domain-containing protein n=2 Tax=Cuscuta sect. Cleistogrammica TaxID=1824901 RepID=A0A484MMD3_9ASTE|nr:hypothetical protein DM860_009705 [Cuscuta australis]VFQ89965.1 unnamed protein product [Cuscuta campestris]